MANNVHDEQETLVWLVNSQISLHHFQKHVYYWPGVPTAMWHGFFSIFLLSSTGKPPINTWQTTLSICEPVEVITSFIWTAISLVGARIRTYSGVKIWMKIHKKSNTEICNTNPYEIKLIVLQVCKCLAKDGSILS